MFKNLLSIIIFVVLFISFYQEEKLVFELSFIDKNISAIDDVSSTTNNNHNDENKEDINMNSIVNEMLVEYNTSVNRKVGMNDTLNVIIPKNISIDNIKCCLSIISVISVLKNNEMVIYHENETNQTSKIESKSEIVVEIKSENELVKLINEIVSSNNLTIKISI